MFRKLMAILALTTLFSTAACTGDGITIVKPVPPVQETEEPTKEEMTPF